MGFINKRSQDVKPQKRKNEFKIIEKPKQSTVMEDKISVVEEILNDSPKPIKRLKKDKGLIERTESSKTILTEDNKQLLTD